MKSSEKTRVAVYVCKTIEYTTSNGEEHKVSLPLKYLKTKDMSDISSKKSKRLLIKKLDISPNENLCFTLSNNKKHVNKFIKNRVSFSNDELDLFIKAIYPFYGFQSL